MGEKTATPTVKKYKSESIRSSTGSN